MGLLFSMLRNNNQTLGNTANMKKEEPEETDVAGSEGTPIDESMGDTGTETPVASNATFMDFFDVWLMAYNATARPYDMPPAVEDALHENEHSP